MKLLSVFLLTFIAVPSHAITWEEFWKPFRSDNYYYYPRTYYPRQQYQICKKEIYREEYIPGDRWNPGYVRRWTEVKEIPCY